VVKDASEAWQELRLKQAVDARYVRFSFTNPADAPELGGLAEVEIWPAGPGEANGGEPTQNGQHGQSGHALAKPGHEHDGAKNRHESKRLKPGKDQSKGQERKKDRAKSSHKQAHRRRGA
jgi:hypothetical protein